MCIQLSRCLIAVPTAKIQISAWKNPSTPAIPRLPRTVNSTRIVSHETSTMRRQKISSAPQGEAKRASRPTR
jgi:hypothetical protein